MADKDKADAVASVILILSLMLIFIGAGVTWGPGIAALIVGTVGLLLCVMYAATS